MNWFIGDFPHEPEANLSKLDRLDGRRVPVTVTDESGAREGSLTASFAHTSSPVVSHTDNTDRLPSTTGEPLGRIVAFLFVLVLFILAGLWIIGLLADSVVLVLIVGALVAAGIWVHAHLR